MPPPEPSPLTALPPVRLFRGWVTLVTAALLLLFAGFSWLQSVRIPELAQLTYPAESAGRVMERHLTFYEGFEAARGWERGLYRLLFGTPEQVRAEVEGAYRELLGYFRAHPEAATSWALQNTQGRLLVLVAERGDPGALGAALETLCDGPDADIVCAGVAYAYGPGSGQGIPVGVAQALRQLPLGWAADRLRLRVGEKAGEPEMAARAARRLAAFGAQWRLRTLAIAAATAALLGAGLVVLARTGRGRPLPRWRAAALDPPWEPATGLAVAVRAGALGVLILLTASLLPGSLLHPNPLAQWSTLLASLPLLWLLHRHLLCPRGLGFRAAFGLTLEGAGVAGLLRAALALAALEWGGAILISWTCGWLGIGPHWAEGLHERWIWADDAAFALAAVDALAWSPLFEELGFRGLAYAALRARLGPGAAALATAAVFSLLHLHSLTGFLTVFWSGLVLALAFERFRSLLPGMAVHAAGNAIALAMVWLFYR